MPGTINKQLPDRSRTRREFALPPLSQTPQREHKVSGKQKEIGGRPGPDPTRYGDWEKAGRCIDF
ncbi:MAG TPA: DUF1674 domain-containing protein [Woeseiaceae bacterium]|nr:DUF1674 domain-containing protein [Woeseiaceae bacterium]